LDNNETFQGRRKQRRCGAWVRTSPRLSASLQSACKGAFTTSLSVWRREEREPGHDCESAKGRAESSRARLCAAAWLATVRGVALLGAALVSLLFGAPAPALGQERPQLAESDVKAALIFSFLRYTTWPTAGDGPRTVCIWNRDTLEGRLTPITRRTVGQRTIALRVVSHSRDLVSCSLLYIGADESRTWPLIEANLEGREIMTVSDAAGFARHGGMIEIYAANSRIGIRINRTAIAGAGLFVEDRLLQLADASPGAAQ
jgi:hypothetical protein